MTKRPRLAAVPDSGVIRVRGARQNNLKGFDLEIPLGKLNVVSGPSGSGKSSLAFDTIYAEGQRRYMETFSPYTRQFFERMDKPQADSIEGIPPAIAIEQANHVRTSRATVGTLTEIHDYFKLWFPRVATALCPSCERQVRPETAPSIAAHIRGQFPGQIVLVAFGVNVPPGSKTSDFFAFLSSQGYLRAWIDGKVVRADDAGAIPRLPGRVPVIQDRVAVTPENTARLVEAIEAALRFGSGRVSAIGPDGMEHLYSQGWHCAYCDLDITPPSPALFSFNNPVGACPECKGFGRVIGIDLARAIPDPSLSIAEGAVKPFQAETGRECQRDLLRACARHGVNIHAPFESLPKADRDFVWGGEDPAASAESLWTAGRWYGVRGYFEWLESKSYKMHVRVQLSRYRSYTACPACRGGRYRPETLAFRVAGETLPALLARSAESLLETLEEVPDPDPAAAMLSAEILARLRYLRDVGVGYLSLDRPARTLSGGEMQRVNLTGCLGASLVNTLFVMDEPTVGLHPRDVGRLLGVMRGLRDKGNTLLVVEHEEAVLRAADHLIELGPGRGDEGGALVHAGPVSDARSTLTGQYLTGAKRIPVPANRREPKTWLKIRGASANNLRNLDADIPLGVFACVTGVSGSGKSTLVHEVLYNHLARVKGEPAGEPGRCRSIAGAETISAVVMVDQSPLSRTPRSGVALYLGVFDPIRQLFASLPDAASRGFTASSFSFNAGMGRCPRCSGAGFERIEMQFLSDVYVRCPECEGRRFRPEVLAVRWEGLSIHDVLEMTVTEAARRFAADPRIAGPLAVLEETGLGYLRLGQPLNVLSGGESQRLNLVAHLGANTAAGRLLILDEPTTGLHLDDVATLLRLFGRLVDKGCGLVVIEHNIEVIKCADYILDLGPEAGAGGGQLVSQGTPEEVAADPASHTGRYLREALAAHPRKRLAEETPSARVAESPVAVPGAITVAGAREHNLKNISLSIPRDQMVVITGLSGSGKSTLAFDILFAEGQRRFLDSMSPYARQFAEQLEKPDVDRIAGLPPTVAIEQRVTRGGGKSTVATVTEVYHFLRLLFAKTGRQHCPDCGDPVEKQTPAAIAAKIKALAKSGPVRILANLVRARKGFHTEVAAWALRHGYAVLLVDGKFERADAFPKLERFREHSVDALIGTYRSGPGLDALVARALEVGKGTFRALDSRNRFTVFSALNACGSCGRSFEELDPRLFSFNSPHGWCPGCRGFGEVWRATVNPRAESLLEQELDEERQHERLDDGEAEPCPDCSGARLNPVARAVRLCGQTLPDFARLTARGALEALGKLRFTGTAKILARDLLPEIRQRLAFMETVGLGYLALDRSAKTLSGGESQRIRLAAQLGSTLRGVLYVLDEPTIGLHPRDNEALLATLEALKRKGNSLVIVEHDEETMRRADTIIDLGPGAGRRGGEVVAIGPLSALAKAAGSATAKFLRQPMRHPTRGTRRTVDASVPHLRVEGARANNLQGITAEIPVGRFTVITGVSGSGKSSLMRRVLGPAAAAALAGKTKRNRGDAPWDRFFGAEYLEAVYEVDQSPIGKTSRSTPGTYIKVFDEIRKLYASMPVARMRGYNAGRFSFNNEGGRCETCQGQGTIKIEMAFLPPSYIPCDGCGGKRYNAATLEVLYQGRSIGDVMGMTLEEAAAFFAAQPAIHRPLSLLCDTGLGYLQLGQPSPTLSGGEAQRIKLVSELVRGVGRSETARMRGCRGSKSVLYLLEEPTIGLHMADVAELIKVIHRLVDDGHTVVMIEHHLAMIAEADHVMDLGPGAGPEGGRIVASGPPERIAAHRRSLTGKFLKPVLVAPRAHGRENPSA